VTETFSPSSSSSTNNISNCFSQKHMYRVELKIRVANHKHELAAGNNPLALLKYYLPLVL